MKIPGEIWILGLLVLVLVLWGRFKLGLGAASAAAVGTPTTPGNISL